MPGAPSPFDLVGAIDYLDTAWQVVADRKHLFVLHGAERIAKLAEPARTAEEFASRLSGLAEVLLSTRGTLRVSRRHGDSDRRGHLEKLERATLGKIDPAETFRVLGAVRTLEQLIDVRDWPQHAPAAEKAARALEELGFGLRFPIEDWEQGWSGIQSAAVTALTTLREAIQSAPDPGAEGESAR